MNNKINLKNNCWCYFVCTLLILLIMIGFINYLIDPYGRYGKAVSSPISRVVHILEEQTIPPELLLFGSSRALKHRPNYSQNIYGVNVSHYAGAIENHYCILRFAVDQLSYPIKFVVLGLEPDLMPTSHPISDTLVTNNALNRWLIKQQPPTIQAFLGTPFYIKELSSLLSILTLRDSLKVTGKYLLNTFSSKYLLNTFSSTAFAGENDYSLPAFLIKKINDEKDSTRARLRQYKTIYEGVTQLDPLRIQYLYKFARFTREKGIHVILFKPGYSQEFWEEMSKISSFKRVNRELEIHYEKLRKQFGWKFLDFRPTHWKGEELDFPDGVHPTTETAHVMDRAIKRKIKDAL